MSQSALARAVVAAEDALNSPELESARARLREIDGERETITDALDAAEKRLAYAQDQLRAFFLGATDSDDDVHSAVAAIADAPPETADRSNEPEEGEAQPMGYVLADGAKSELPALEDLPEAEQDAVIAVLDDDTPFDGIGGTTGLVIGRPGEVSDAAVAEARALERREAEQSNGATRFNPWS